MRYIAFLRAINVGGHIVKMDRLRALFEALGFTGVETFIASGNVIFESPSEDAAALERKIEAHLKKELGYKVETFLRTPEELAAVAAHEPFSPPEPESTLYIGFLGSTPGKEAQAKLMTYASEIDDFHIHQREVYWKCRKTMSQTKFSGTQLEKALGMPTTLRNVTTVRKLAAKYPPV